MTPTRRSSVTAVTGIYTAPPPHRKISPAVPAVTPLCVNPRMARLAQCDQIVPVMCPAFTQRKFMVDLFGFSHHTLRITQFTERMLSRIPVTDPLPCTPVLSLGILIPAVLLIITVHFTPVLITVPFPRRHKPAASRIPARHIWFPRHLSHLRT